eukprot:jgi/Chrzof1/11422/Cz05g36050.t1
MLPSHSMLAALQQGGQAHNGAKDQQALGQDPQNPLVHQQQQLLQHIFQNQPTYPQPGHPSPTSQAPAVSMPLSRPEVPAEVQSYSPPPSPSAVAPSQQQTTAPNAPLAFLQATLMSALQNNQQPPNQQVQAGGLNPNDNAAAQIAAILAAVQDQAGNLGARSSNSGGELVHSGIVSAREKNRQAQRRFRERQKSLITDLKDKVSGLEKKVDDQSREIAMLREENNILKAKLEGKSALLQATMQQVQQAHNM